MTKVLILGDKLKGGTAEVVREFEAWLSERVDSIETILDRDVPLEQVQADLACVFGGDGSILAAARRMGENQMPTLGINLGRLGFLTTCGLSQATVAAEAALAGELHEERLAMLACHVERHDGETTDSVRVLNDCVISRGDDASLVTLEASRNGAEVATYSGDGLIVATPTGTTAYSLGAGGPVLAPDLEAVVLTPLASHSLALRPLVLPLAHELDIVVRETGAVNGCPMDLDGQVSMRLSVGDRVCLRASPVTFRHLAWREDSFFQIFREKFGWSDAPRLK